MQDVKLTQLLVIFVRVKLEFYKLQSSVSGQCHSPNIQVTKAVLVLFWGFYRLCVSTMNNLFFPQWCWLGVDTCHQFSPRHTGPKDTLMFFFCIGLTSHCIPHSILMQVQETNAIASNPAVMRFCHKLKNKYIWTILLKQLLNLSEHSKDNLTW